MEKKELRKREYGKEWRGREVLRKIVEEEINGK